MSWLCPASARSCRRPAVVVAVLTLLAAGCAGRGDITGRVTYKGKPLVWGTVQVEGSDHIVRYGNIGGDGTYTVRDLPTGEARVAVSSINPSSSDFQARRAGSGPDVSSQPGNKVKGWFPIPEKYDTPHKSGLTYTVQRGENKYDIDLQ